MGQDFWDIQYERPVNNVVVWLAAVPVCCPDRENGGAGHDVLGNGNRVGGLEELGRVVVHVYHVDYHAAAAP